MPSFGQNGGAMNDSLAQHSAQTPSPSTGSRQATQSVGSAMSSASRAACTHAPRHAFSAPRRWLEMDRDGDASASMHASVGSRGTQAGRVGFSSSLPVDLANARPMTGLAENWTNGVQVVVAGERKSLHACCSNRSRADWANADRGGKACTHEVRQISLLPI
jgi:acylphosphatase